jgi:DNA-binding transcriptional regulator YhcF (GntR family)
MSDSAFDRLAVKTLDQLFVQELISGFELAPRTAQGILEVAKGVFVQGNGLTTLQVGQVKAVVIATSARHGQPLSSLDKREVTLTVDAGPEDLAVLQEHGALALRRVRILRLAEEAFEQEGLLTEEDLGRFLHVHARTIRRDIQALRRDGFLVRTRGYHHSIGRGQTHKVLIIEKSLQRQGPYEIARQVKHSLPAVQRYIQAFGRVVYLHRRQVERAEMAFLVGISERTVQQYLDLYARYDRPEYQDRLNEIAAPPTTQPFLALGKKGAKR